MMRLWHLVAVVLLACGLFAGTTNPAESRGGGGLCVHEGVCHKVKASCSAGGPIAATYVQGKAGAYAATTATTVTLSFSAAVKSGDAVMGGITYDPQGGSQSVVSIVDDKGNNYTVGATATDATNVQSFTVFSKTGITNGPTTITITLAVGGTNVVVAMDELANVGPLDQSTIQVQNSPGTGANAISSGSVTTTQNGELVYGITNNEGAPVATPSAGAGFTLRTTDTDTIPITSESQVQSNAGSIAATFTTGTNSSFITGILTFAPITSAGNCAPVAPPPQNTFFLATAAGGGNDGSDGLAPTVGGGHGPFLTFGKCQTAMRASTTIKTCTVRAGTYSFTSSPGLSLAASDAGETWQFYTADGFNTAIMDGGSTVQDGIVGNGAGISNITINGLKIQNFTRYGIWFNGPDGSTTTGNKVINSEVANLPLPPPVENVAAGPAGINISNTTNAQVKNNYVHDIGGPGIMSFAFDTGTSTNGENISGNVVLRTCQASSDCGAIYQNMHATATAAGSVSITNNYIRDYGHSSAGQGGTNFGTVMCVYLDDQASNVTVSGNVCAPPSVQFPSGTDLNTGFPACNNSAVTLQNNDGLSGNGFNTWTGNIFDAGATSQQGIGYIFGSSNVLQHNVILYNFAGGLHTCSSADSGIAYESGISSTISNNGYVNYGGASVPSNGNSHGDTAPITFTTGQLGTCANADYSAFSAAAHAIGGPVAFPGITGGFGPPGFAVPSSTNHSC